MIRVAALTSGKNVPSTRFRVRQYIELLKEHNIDVSEHYPAISKDKATPFLGSINNKAITYPLKAAFSAAKLLTVMPGLIRSYGADVVWLSRGLLLGIPTIEAILKRPLILDVDDAIWLSNGGTRKRASYMACIPTAIMAGNSYIADWYSQYSDNVFIVPTAVDADRYFPSKEIGKKVFTIGWIGTQSNLKYLETLQDPLSKFFKEYPNSKLLIISDKKPNFSLLNDRNVEYVPWSKDTEVEMIQLMDVGLMPLDDTPWSRGKCAFKMLQYMACGKPVIVSPVGMNIEVLAHGSIGYAANSNDEWHESLLELAKDSKLKESMGSNARKIVLDHYCTKAIAPRISEIIKSTT